MREVTDMQIHNFNEARQQLRQFYNQSREYKLDTMRAFMDFLGNPQDSLKIVHVAGTSGKTSTAYYVAALLGAAGYKVGLTVSPHVDEVNERVQIGLVPLPEAIFCAELSEFLELAQKSELQLSYFEVMVAFAYWYFAKAKVDYAVVEVGLGGRIDGTNVIARDDKICVITDIGLDHTKILGNTLPEIAAEKAGIILEGNTVFTHQQPPEVISVLQRVATDRKATLHVVAEKPVKLLHNLPLFQQHNMQLAMAAAGEVLQREGRQLADEHIRTAAQAYVPSRMEIVTYHGKTIIIDGAHNAQKLHALVESIRAKYPQLGIAALVAFVAGDEQRAREGLRELLSQLSSVVITEFTTEQDVPKAAVSAAQVAEWCEKYGFHALQQIKNPAEALDALIHKDEDILLVTGSFYLQSHIRPLIIKS
jgi:dihydrofolate synthase/folylpolyglutamate synthase